jgi:predicted TIM-barrel fold metal-dependent hydrolase
MRRARALASPPWPTIDQVKQSCETARPVFTGLTGCSWLFRRRDLHPVCPTAPEVSFPGGPLTIDAHCHVFNGTDLQVEEFLSRVAIKQGGALGYAAKVIGDILENLAWKYAPSGDEELARLYEVAMALKTCSTEGHASRVAALRQDGYERGVKQLQAAAARSEVFKSLQTRKSLGTLSVEPESVDEARLQALALIESLPKTAKEYNESPVLKTLGLESFSSMSIKGAFAFVLQNFQYRYVSVHDYLSTYNRPGQRVVDLMLPSMVDYDFWLKKGSRTHTSLATQVHVMRQMAIVTGGRVHAFVPFDPLRQVAFTLEKTPEDSLTLMQKAIREDGAVGVKLYPPMGFAALGNAAKDGKGFWKQPWLPDWADRADLGQLLDGAMRQVFNWCQAEQVPLMAHTSQSNGPSKDFEELTGAQYWKQALAEFPRLRVSFGHFGGSAPLENGLDRARSFADLMSAGGTAAGSRAFADAGYFVEVLSKEPQMLALVRKLYEETSNKGDAALANRFLYGTDWEMTLTEGLIKPYQGLFELLFAELEARPGFQAQGLTQLSRRFFGLNAARWAGLFAGDRTRDRLDRFYQTHSIEKPDWAVKLDGMAQPAS